MSLRWLSSHHGNGDFVHAPPNSSRIRPLIWVFSLQMPENWVEFSLGLMRAFFNQHRSKCYALLRVIVGCLFACHGAQKLFGVLGGQSEIHDPEGLVAGIIEFVAGIFVTLGLFTRAAAFIASGEMAVAYFKAHASRSFWPIVNHGELAMLYCFVFLYISFHGAGAWGVDTLRARPEEET